MKSDILNNEAPCLKCPLRDTGKSCELLCLRLAAHSSGKPWEDQPLPYVAKPKKRGKAMEGTGTGEQKPTVAKKPRKRADIIKLTLCKYPEIWGAVFKIAATSRLPVRHVIMTLLSEAITTRQNKKKLLDKLSRK